MIKTNTQTITLDGTEQEVRFNRNYPYFFVQNQGSSDVLMSTDSGTVEITTCGKNLFPWNDYTKAPFAAWGHTSINKSNDVINYTAKESAASSGTYIAHNDFIKYFTTLLNVKSFTLSCEMRADIDNVTVAFGMQRSAMSTCNVNVDWKKYICVSSYIDDSACQPVWSMRNLVQTATLYIRNIQIEIGDTATDYEPYKANTASITTALPLCGIPVDSGGNYTDNSGQQWVCDELIYNADGTGKIIKRTAKIDSYNGETITTPYMSTTGALTTGATVIYALAEPQEIELTAAEMAALRQLQTFDGVTNIYNDGGADMGVKFCTNKMLSKCVMPILSGLQKQIDELKAAILSMGSNV